MKNIQHIISIGLSLALLFALSACTPPAPTPTATAILSSTSTPTATLTALPTSTLMRATLNYDGRWDAGTLPDGLLSGELIFQIEKNQVTNISFPFTMRFNGCTIMSSVYGTADKSTIQGDQLHALMLLDDGGQLSFDGTFSSAQEASGTRKFTGKWEGCGAYERTVKWTAVNGPIPPTPTATAPKPTTTATRTRTSTPTKVPLGLPPSTMSFDAQTLASAAARTKSATTYRAEISITLPALVMGVTPSANMFDVFTGEQFSETNGANRRVRVTGMLATLVGADTTKGYEYIVIDKTLYIHGPLSPSLAPEDKWYPMDINSPYIDTLPVTDMIDRVAKSTNNWSRFEKARSGESFDEQKCDIYSAGQTSALDVIAGLYLNTGKLVTDQATTTAIVCKDQYMHRLTTTWIGHDAAEPKRQVTFTLDLHFYDFSADIVIKAPTDVTPLVTRTPTVSPKK